MPVSLRPVSSFLSQRSSEVVLVGWTPLCNVVHGSFDSVTFQALNKFICYLPFPLPHRLVGLVVKASASRAEGPGFDSCLRCGDFSGSMESYRWLKNWQSSGTLPGTWRYGVITGSGLPGVSILWLDETESLTCSFYLSGDM